MQTFNALLFTMQTGLKPLQGLFVHVQNRHASVQAPFAHGAKPSCKRSKTDCSVRKTSLQMFSDIVHDTKTICLNGNL